ncbi:alpha/beta hydrolase [Shewanella sp. VB17]|uniref:alpha/beta hydrolase n=1 Tax=Shewanella sp. VB17 TaxID=2739432 RepID=UPI001C273AD1|nr:alpha/beta hydrolase [Shewanella sp. VB17]
MGLFLSSSCIANNIYESFPNEIKPNEKYVFYSHGFIVEGKNPTPINPRWGMYDFPEIKKSLSDDSYNLIAYHRPKDTNPREFAKKLTENANALINNGVKPENITFVGFSRGGAITVLTSNYLASEKVNFVILAGCSKVIKNNPELEVIGHVFSVFETSDGVGSCQFLIDRSKKVNTFKEISITTGKEHGAFYKPLPEWIIPVKKWLKSDRS